MKSTKNVRRVCPTCGGKGNVPLSSDMASTLEIVVKRKQVTAGDVYEALLKKNPYIEFIGVTAINRRLEDLREMGLVDRQRKGRAWEYFSA